jgi:hypothetical protein
MNCPLLFRNGTGFMNRRPFGNMFRVPEPLSQTIQKRHKQKKIPPRHPASAM